MMFDTIIVGRLSGTTGTGGDYYIFIIELQCWINNSNILISNSANLQSKFVLWSDKNTEISSNGNRTLSMEYNNNVIYDSANSLAHSNGNVSTDSGIITNITLSNINDIQSIVYFNVLKSGLQKKKGLTYNELVNNVKDVLDEIPIHI